MSCIRAYKTDSYRGACPGFQPSNWPTEEYESLSKIFNNHNKRLAETSKMFVIKYSN